ncbi:rfaE bifunctional protein, domain I/rfaE bifunctional protein, domain II [Actinokineospora iranica]|uniref:Bifunctional protein HldE n=1 Tax=Actinokineospora iranica TaxID=1271860 RepID=A0A1G6WN19_9PSEU|nr:rfaE bifunctional protein, domain I/rfaE bifunctional protein, domain II [Actinokineospora iranica]
MVVVGDALLDGWMTGRCDRLCREAPAPVVDVVAETFVPGGAGNTAVNLAALGARTSLVTAVGDDDAGERLLDTLRAAGVDVRHVLRVPGRKTTTKRRIVAGDQVMLRFDDGESRPLPDDDAARLSDLAAFAIRECDAVVVCDYGTGVLAEPVRRELVRLRDRVPLVVVDAHEAGRWRELRPDVVTPNAAEAARLIDVPALDRGDLDGHRAALRGASGAAAVVVTLDRDGAVLFDGDAPMHRTHAHPAPDNFTAGAGDTFVAALTVAAAQGAPLAAAVEMAQAAADIVVHRPGTAVCSRAELVERLDGGPSAAVSVDELVRLVAEHRAAGRRIVFTNGCFDVLHRGHVAYLDQAKRLGDVLIVAVNSDRGVARLKGPGRPVNPVADRVAVLGGLSCVDYLVVFDEDTAVDLIRAVRPDLYVKGGDYSPDMLAESEVVREVGGEVRILDYLADHSTSAVIDRIRTTA